VRLCSSMHGVIRRFPWPPWFAVRLISMHGVRFRGRLTPSPLNGVPHASRSLAIEEVMSQG